MKCFGKVSVRLQEIKKASCRNWYLIEGQDLEEQIRGGDCGYVGNNLNKPSEEEKKYMVVFA